ncbi:unnamed protein product [Laminaria digitata]
MKPARGERCPSGQRRGSAAPGDDRVPSPVQESFHTYTTPTTRGRKRRSPGSIPPRAVVLTFPLRVVQHHSTLRVLLLIYEVVLDQYGQRRASATGGAVAVPLV